MSDSPRLKKPDWLKTSLPKAGEYRWMNQTILDQDLHTICTSGKCPNSAECWSRGTATFMILGDICTRACRFCNVTTGKPQPPDPEEPFRVADAIRQMRVRHAVLTSVDRDDLPDAGAAAWVATITRIREMAPGVTLEVLIPDFNGREDLLDQIIEAAPEVISHNLETVRRLTPVIRTKAKYDNSLRVLRYISAHGLVAKSGIMLGLGETEAEIAQTMDDLRTSGVQVMTIGQYLQPSRENIPVAEYISPECFNKYREWGLNKGFRIVESGPLVRSSYHAETHVIPS